jgi:hypothetical protein
MIVKGTPQYKAQKKPRNARRKASFVLQLQSVD